MADPESGKEQVMEQVEKGPSRAAIAKAIEGLQFRTNKALPVLDDQGKPVKEQGKVKVTYVPDLRPMTMDDVLKASYDGGELTIVSKDGSKYRIGKGKSSSAAS